MFRSLRLLPVLLIVLLYALVLLRDLQVTQETSLRFGFSALIAVLFLIVGTLVWLYASSRRVALVLFCFACAATLTFAAETGAGAGDALLSEVGSASPAIGLVFMVTTFLLFPHNILSPSTSANGSRWLSGVLRGYVILLVLLCIAVVGIPLSFFFQGMPNPAWSGTLSTGYTLLGLLGAAISLVLSSRKAQTLRERQQLRFLVGGVIIAITPFVLLTLLPQLMHAPEVMDSETSTATFCILPLALGYAIVRYQLLIFDSAIQKVVANTIGLLGLVLLSYLLVVSASMVLHDATAKIAYVTVGMAGVGSLLWWSARAATQRLFFSEMQYYHRLLARPDRLVLNPFDLDEAAKLMITAAIDAFEAPAACLFVLDEEAGCYRPFLATQDNHRASQLLARQVVDRSLPVAVAGKKIDWLDLRDPLLLHLTSVTRPVLLSELLQAEGTFKLSRLRTSTQGGESDPLLAPVLLNRKLIGVLALAGRGDQQAYAGADFEVVNLIHARFASLLEAARLYTLENSYAALVMKLYTAMPREAATGFTTMEEATHRCAAIAAAVTSGSAEIGLVGAEQGEQMLRRSIHIGGGPSLLAEQGLQVRSVPAEAFFTIVTQHHPLPWLNVASHAGDLPLAWLPLKSGERLLGVLLLTYPRPHAFSPREQQLLEAFAQQWATTLDNVRIALASVQRTEANRVRDALLVEASRGVSLPLTTMSGYLELIHDYGMSLSPEVRATFLANAQQSCRELVTMMTTISQTQERADREETALEEVRQGPSSP